MGDIATALVRAGGYLLFRHQSVIGVVAWILVFLLIGTVAYVVVGWFHNKKPREKGRHEKDDPRP
jgi:hypothetical protein